MVFYPVHRLIFKIVFKRMGRACGVGRARVVFLCGFAALRAKKYHDPLSEHDLKD
jgi:hypothetical protein